MEIRPATFADLEMIERLRLETFSVTSTSALRNVPLHVQLDFRLKMWQQTGKLLKGLLVGLDGDQFVGTVAIGATETTLRFAWAQLPVLRMLGIWHMVRYLGVWALTHYEPAADEAYLYGLVVAQAYRRRAAGRELVMAAEEHARQWGKRVASGFIDRSNSSSLQLFQKMGYCCSEPKRNALRRLLVPNPAFVQVEKQL
jgi:GNAT superfamily N-acetyltransferase